MRRSTSDQGMAVCGILYIKPTRWPRRDEKKEKKKSMRENSQSIPPLEWIYVVFYTAAHDLSVDLPVITWARARARVLEEYELRNTVECDRGMTKDPGNDGRSINRCRSNEKLIPSRVRQFARKIESRKRLFTRGLWNVRKYWDAQKYNSFFLAFF